VNTDCYTDEYTTLHTDEYTDRYTDEYNLKNEEECIKNDNKNEKEKPSADLDFLKGDKRYE
jgi:hypothetical protein